MGGMLRFLRLGASGFVHTRIMRTRARFVKSPPGVIFYAVFRQWLRLPAAGRCCCILQHAYGKHCGFQPHAHTAASISNFKGLSSYCASTPTPAAALSAFSYGPVHAFTNTYEPNRNVLLSKENSVPSVPSVVSKYAYTTANGVALPTAPSPAPYDGDGNMTRGPLPASDAGTHATLLWDAERCDRIGSILDGGAAVARRVKHAM